ncbi:hypothetical protein IAQ61_000968 [Plenodomus lingam]|uniref:uncharacterized protein n=1 Tax=Leptosphaeria maculans TaxID=5022 RepID=UPI00331EB4E1|nr:hypothetical protein IAQ61_000968 [Plenodomus lingam]
MKYTTSLVISTDMYIEPCESEVSNTFVSEHKSSRSRYKPNEPLFMEAISSEVIRKELRALEVSHKSIQPEDGKSEAARHRLSEDVHDDNGEIDLSTPNDDSKARYPRNYPQATSADCYTAYTSKDTFVTSQLPRYTTQRGSLSSTLYSFV